MQAHVPMYGLQKDRSTTIQPVSNPGMKTEEVKGVGKIKFVVRETEGVQAQPPPAVAATVDN